MSVVNLGVKRAGVGVIVLDDDDDWTLKLTPVGASEWPTGTSAWCRFYDDLGEIILEIAAVVTPDALTFSMQTGGPGPTPYNLPDEGCPFKIRVSLPGDPTTEATLWRGRMEKE